MNKNDKLNCFLEKAKIIHPSLDFSSVNEYVNSVSKIEVICHCKDYLGNEHGKFIITPNNLLSGKGCPKCAGKGFTSEERKLFCSKKHNEIYDYSKANFKNVKDKTVVICKKHGEFMISYDSHFNKGNKCPLCSHLSKDTESFKKCANTIHGGFYQYDKVNYINSHEKVIITCPTHGDFSQTPNAHLSGQGCPKCANNNYLLEKSVENLLKTMNVSFVRNQKFEWLKRNKNGQMTLDFFLPKINLAIECQGKQHFGIGGWTKAYDFEKQRERDVWKQKQCLLNGIKLVYYANKKDAPKDYISKIFVSQTELMEFIRYLYKNNETL